MKKLIAIIACSIALIHCQKTEAPKVDPRDAFVGTFKGSLNLHSNDGSINDNIFETWIITNSGSDLKVSRQLTSGTFDLSATASAGKINVAAKTAQSMLNGKVVTFILGSGQCALNGSVLNVDLSFSITDGNNYIPGSFVGNLIKQ